MPSETPLPPPVFLVGYRCTGKTTIGRRLALALGREFQDTDQLIESRAKTTIARMVAEKGWEFFRAMETQVLSELSLEPPSVIATGGGIILAEENRRMLKSHGTCIWLQADRDVILQRLKADARSQTLRPDLTDDGIEAETEKMLTIRDPLYRDVSNFFIDTSACSPEHCVELILRRLDQ